MPGRQEGFGTSEALLFLSIECSWKVTQSLQLGPDNLVSAVRLIRTEVRQGNGPCCQVGELQDNRVRRLRDEYRLEIEFAVVMPTVATAAVAGGDPAKLQFEFPVLPSAAALEDYVDGPATLPLLAQRFVKLFHAEVKRIPVWVPDVGASREQLAFVDNCGANRHWRCFNQAIETGIEPFPQIPIGQQDCERSLTHADVMLMQHDSVVPPDAELEMLKGRNDGGGVVRLAHDTENQREDRILRVDGDKPMVAAFVSENNKVRKLGQYVPTIARLFAMCANPTSNCRATI